MDKQSIELHLIELKQAQTNELNIRRLAEATTALKNFDMLDQSKAMQELEQTEDSLTNYMAAKKRYNAEKTQNNTEGVEIALKLLLINLEETITEIWSLCDCNKEKELITRSLHKTIELIK